MAYPKDNHLLMTCQEDSAVKQMQFLVFGCWLFWLFFLNLESKE